MNSNITLFILKVDLNYVIVDESVAGNNVPLTEAELDKLRSLRTYLIKNIHYTSIVDSLLQYGVISEMHKQSIEPILVEYKRVEILLDILQRRSRENFYQFQCCLKLCRHEFVADAFADFKGVSGITTT